MTCFSDERPSYAVLGYYLTGCHSTVLIARHASALAGLAVLRLTWEQGRRIGIIVFLGVNPVHQGNGMGRRLLREAHHWCQQAGARRLRLEVAPENLAALTLYQSHGYRVVDRLPHYYGRGRDGFRMVRPASWQVRREIR